MMKIYGQNRLFGAFVRKTRSETPEFLRTNGHFPHFVRNRHFSGGPITDKESIFIDVSVTTVILTNSVLRIICSIAALDFDYGQNGAF